MTGKFDSPFAHNAVRRQPDASERLNGFPCGPADQTLFNQLFYSIQAELGHLIGYAGFSDDPDDHQQVRKAIEALIASAVGQIDWGEGGGGGGGEGPDLSGFLLLNQARQRLPFFPEVVSSDNRINVTQPTGGTVLVPPTVNVLHRGIFPLSTSDFSEIQRTFVTTANKTYHLRLRLSPGLEALTLNDLASGGYNPGATAETSAVFDTTFDDMLIARVVTNGSNVATITNLRNAVALSDDILNTGDLAPPNANLAQRNAILTWNWGRVPRMYSIWDDGSGQNGSWTINDHDHHQRFVTRTRYGANINLGRDGATAYNIRLVIGA